MWDWPGFRFSFCRVRGCAVLRSPITSLCVMLPHYTYSQEQNVHTTKQKCTTYLCSSFWFHFQNVGRTGHCQHYCVRPAHWSLQKSNVEQQKVPHRSQAERGPTLSLNVYEVPNSHGAAGFWFQQWETYTALFIKLHNTRACPVSL